MAVGASSWCECGCLLEPGSTSNLFLEWEVWRRPLPALGLTLPSGPVAESSFGVSRGNTSAGQ